jgi:hypothetical protein
VHTPHNVASRQSDILQFHPLARAPAWERETVPIRAFLAGKSFDPETLALLNAAFEGACAELDVSANARHSRETVAKRVLELADGHRDLKALRAAVVASLVGS